MIFETHKLNEEISPYIQSIFHLKDFMPNHSIERVVPTGHLFIIFELDGFTRSTFNNETLEPIRSYSKVWVSGMHKNHITISAHQKSEMLVIQFKPYGAYPFFHFPIHKLNEQVLPAEQVFQNEILELRDDILERKTSEEKFNIVEKWLLDKYDSGKTPSRELLGILEKLQAAPVVNYSEIIDGYSKTQKHLIDQFKKYVGLTPKYYQRVLRFNEILQQIHKSEEIEWSQIAYQFEYADQSHFIKEFKHFSGINPQEFIKQAFHKDPPNFFPLDREG